MKLVPAALAAALIAGGLSPAAAATASAPDLAGLLGVDRIDPREVTMALRDLSVQLPSLGGPKARAAHRMLARPTDGATDPYGDGYPDLGAWTFSCTTNFCFHWVSTGDEAVDPTDADVNGRPDQVDLTATTMEGVWNTFVNDFQFRAPKDDTGALTAGAGNPNGLFDIYLANIGDQGVYGYCASDDPDSEGNQAADVSAFCVLDNDYSFDEFGQPSAQALQVTGAHEFFHAVQYAYNHLTDSWMLESMAAWVEDEVFDDVNDNLQYLPESPIGIRGLSLDHGEPEYVYGSWIWWKYLGVILGEPEARALVRLVLEFTDAGPGGQARLSHEALRGALSAISVDLGVTMGLFGAANASPGTSYPEGATYPSTGFAVSATVTSSTAARTRTVTVDHLAAKVLRFTPGVGMDTGAKLRLTVDLPRLGSQPDVVAIVRFLDGSTLVRVPTTNANGIGSLRLQFNRAIVRDILVSVANGSTRFNCFQGAPFSCEGVPRDDRMQTLVRTVPLPG